MKLVSCLVVFYYFTISPQFVNSYLVNVYANFGCGIIDRPGLVFSMLQAIHAHKYVIGDFRSDHLVLDSQRDWVSYIDVCEIIQAQSQPLVNNNSESPLLKSTTKQSILGNTYGSNLQNLIDIFQNSEGTLLHKYFDIFWRIGSWKQSKPLKYISEHLMDLAPLEMPNYALLHKWLKNTSLDENSYEGYQLYVIGESRLRVKT